MRTTAIAVVLLVAMAAESMADGKMYWREPIPPDLPYQRALILFREGTQTLILQSKYEVPEISDDATIGWVVPVPAEPEVASMSAWNANRLFRSLAWMTPPRETFISKIIIRTTIYLTCLVSAGMLVLCLLSFVVPVSPWIKKNRRRLIRYSIPGVILSLFLMMIHTPLGRAGSESVAVIAEHQVGIYDVRVVRADDAGELISWLNENDFQFDEQDTEAFDSYISRGWCFVVAIINPSEDHAEWEVAAEGLAAPLILRFPVQTPVYPIALTGTAGYDTEVLIYLASTARMCAGGRLTLRYADASRFVFSGLLSRAEPENFFDTDDLDFPYLSKFGDTLTPEQMSEDIIFTPAEDQTPYQEHIIRW